MESLATETVLTPDSPHVNGIEILKERPVPSQLVQMLTNMETSQAPVSPQGDVSMNRIDMLRSMETRYEKMLLDEVLWYLNLLAKFAHWTLLAGYLISPSTFTSLQMSVSLKKSLDMTRLAKPFSL